MPLNYQPGGDVSSGSAFLSEPGTFHVIITQAREGVTRHDGSPVPDGLFEIKVAMLAGTAKGQENKTIDINFVNGKPNSESSIKFQKKKVDRLLLAIGMATALQIEKKEAISINVGHMLGRQFVAKFSKDKSPTTGKEYVNLSFSDIWHVDDPEVAAIPKDVNKLREIPSQFRMIGNRPLDTPTSKSALEETAGGAPPEDDDAF